MRGHRRVLRARHRPPCVQPTSHLTMYGVPGKKGNTNMRYGVEQCHGEHRVKGSIQGIEVKL